MNLKQVFPCLVVAVSSMMGCTGAHPWVEYECTVVVKLPKTPDTCGSKRQRWQNVEFRSAAVERGDASGKKTDPDGAIAATRWLEDAWNKKVQAKITVDPASCTIIADSTTLNATGPKPGTRPENWPNPIDYSLAIMKSMSQDVGVNDAGVVTGLEDAGNVDSMPVADPPDCEPDPTTTTCSITGGGTPSACITCIEDNCCTPYDTAGGIGSAADVIVQCYNSGDTSQCPLQPPYSDPKLSSFIACINQVCVGPACPVQPLIYVSDGGAEP